VQHRLADDFVSGITNHDVIRRQFAVVVMAGLPEGAAVAQFAVLRDDVRSAFIRQADGDAVHRKRGFDHDSSPGLYPSIAAHTCCTTPA
jgi:hypothetical protein